MSVVFRTKGNWKAVQRASRADCVLFYNDKVMATGDKPYITRLFHQFSDIGETL